MFRRALLGVFVWVELAACGATHAQGRGLSEFDYVEIRQLAAMYAHALDTGAERGYALANLFTADGELIRPDARGREEIAATVRKRPRQGPAHVAHFALNHVIEATPEGAIGWQYVVEFRFDENRTSTGVQGAGRGGSSPDQRSLVGRRGGELVSTGRYEDIYVRSASGWRFRHREFVPTRPANVGVPVGLGTRAPSVRPAPGSQPALPAQAPSSALTAADYLDIEQLVASYGHALDSGFNDADNGDAYARLFTPDGVFYSRGRPYRGREALAALARAQPHGPHFVRHFLTNHVITASAGEVTGRQYLVVIDIGEEGGPSTVYLGGYYEDLYAKTSEGWRFQERRSFGARTDP